MRFISSLPLLAQRILCTLYVFPALVIDLFLSWLFQVLYTLVSYPFVTREQRLNTCGHIFRFVSFLIVDCLNPFWHCHVLNEFPRGLHKERDNPSKKILLMMNHVSSADPFLAIRSFLPRDGSWIAKAVLFTVPIGGWAMGNADDLPVYFLDKHKHNTKGEPGTLPRQTANAEGEEATAAPFVNSFALVPGTAGLMMERARQKLRRGRMLCVFPEGTRSAHAEKPGYLEPFRQGFFDLALEEGAMIVPLAISGTDRAWPRGSVLMQPAHCYFSFGDVIESSRFSSAVELAAAVRKELLRRREAHPDRVAKTAPHY